MTDFACKTAILYETQPDALFAPFLENRAFCMLPVGGKPLIQYWCEHLKMIGIQQLNILVRSFPDKVRKFVGSGERWGIDIQVTSLPLRSNLLATLSQARAWMTDDVLLANIAGLPVQAFNKASLNPDKLQQKTLVKLHIEQAFDAPAIVNADALGRFLKGEESFTAGFYAEPMKFINTPRDLWQINMDWLHKRLDDPLPKGFMTEEGVSVGVGAQIKKGFVFKTPCHIGNYSLLEEKIRMGPNVIVGDSCIIDETTIMADSVVMDGTYIGTHSSLKRVIVDGGLLYDIDHDIQTWIDDPAIISAIDSRKARVGIFERLLALLILILTLPVWIILLSKGTSNDDLQIPAGKDLDGQPRTKSGTVKSLNVSHRFWRKILWLFQVLRGQLHLIGITALTEGQHDIPLWANDLKKYRPGVMNLTDIEGVQNPDDDMRYVTDNFYLATRVSREDVKRFFKWLGHLFIGDKNS